MKNKFLFLVTAAFLIFGVLFKLTVTANGNFLFNMDNARDMIDVREMVVLKHLRLIGPTSGIEGFFNGPGWYYLLAIPFILSGGNPYASIILMISLWAIGGFFLLKIISRYGTLATLVVGFIWLSSNYLSLGSVYAFNPTPVTFLMPLFIFLFEKYLKNQTLLLSISLWFLAGLFFNFEMAFGVFMPLIIFVVIFILGKQKLFLNKTFWIGVLFFILTLLPQFLFDLKHDFLLSKSLMQHFTSDASNGGVLSLYRLTGLKETYINVILATFMNWKLFTYSFLFLLLIILLKKFKDKTFRDPIFLICLSLIFVPLLGYCMVKVGVMPWHLGGSMVSLIILLGILVFEFGRNIFLKIILSFLTLIFIFYSIANLNIIDSLFYKKPSQDPSNFQSEVNAIDFVYRKANGKNFKVYVYLPSVIDYSYQYLFWWYGVRKFGYLPKEYAYQPKKPNYIKNKELFNNNVYPPVSSGLVFLIKEQNRLDLMDLWKNDFKDYPKISEEKVGPLIVEIRGEKI